MAGLTPDDFAKSVRAALDAARESRTALVALTKGAPARERLRAFEAIGLALNRRRGEVGLYSAVHPSSELRDMAEVLEQELVAFGAELSLDRDVYDALATLELPVDATPEETRLLEHALRDYRRSGVDKDEATRARLRALQDELVEIGQQFDRNIVQGTREVRLERGHRDLVGLPADFLASHPEGADGSLTLTTDPPDMLPVMLYAADGEVRRRMAHEHANRAYPQNIPVLESLLAKRHEFATLLGYPSWAAYVTEDKMVGSAEAARAFVERVTELARPIAAEEYGELLAEKRKDVPGAATLEVHEVRYYTERTKRAKFAFDSQDVRPYFPYAAVQAGVLATAARLYGVEMRRIEGAPTWHPSVASWDVLDGGEVIARFHLDMFPRPGKYKHAAMFDLVHGLAGSVLPEAVLVCNFAEPRNGDPALMLHSQVTTLFHEFGHLLHHLFGGWQRWLRFSGIATEWDFVEVPSQLFEEWAWDEGVLARFARHHETGAPIPGELVQSLRAAEEYGKGLSVLTQMFYATLSLDYYSGDPSSLDTDARLRELRARITPFVEPPGHHFQAAFGHLHGYSAIYYTYMWSLVIAKDLWDRFAQDPMDVTVARSYRDAILAPGGTRDARELVGAFLGREYAFDAWERWLRA